MAMNELRQLRGLRVLVAEDELLISQLIREILVSLQCTVIGPARNLDEAMQAIRTNGMDGALLDVQLGEASIYPAIDELVRRGIPFILVTGQGNLRQVSRASSQCADSDQAFQGAAAGKHDTQHISAARSRRTASARSAAHSRRHASGEREFDACEGATDSVSSVRTSDMGPAP